MLYTKEGYIKQWVSHINQLSAIPNGLVTCTEKQAATYQECRTKLIELVDDVANELEQAGEFEGKDGLAKHYSMVTGEVSYK